MTTVTIEQVVQRIRTLPPEQLAEVVAFLDSLEAYAEDGIHTVFLCATEEQILTDNATRRDSPNNDHVR